MKTERKVLGRGLSSLVSGAFAPAGNLARDIKVTEESPIANTERISKLVPISEIDADPNQPRREFTQEELEELSTSIRNLGILQPIIVSPLNGRYRVIAGERRWRAAKLAGLQEIPVIIRDVNEQEALKLALVENIQRQQLNPLEEALGYQRLIEEFSLTQEQVAETIGKSRATIANILRLLKLSPEIQEFLKSTRISMGHAKAILSVREPAAQANLAKKIIEEGLSVRQVEEIVSRSVILDGGTAKRGKNDKPVLKTDFPEVNERLRKHLGTRVSIHHTPKGRGTIKIDYFSPDELDRIIELICHD